MDANAPALPHHVHHNLHAVEELRERERERVGRHQRAVERVAHALARPITIYALLACGGTWVAYNLAAAHRAWSVLDAPPFPWLQGAVTFFSAAVATCVLIAQARLRREADRRAAVELQVNLLAEQKATKIIQLLEELRRDLPNVRNRKDSVAEALQQEVDPKDVHDALGDERI